MVIAFLSDVTSRNLVGRYGSFPEECAEFTSNIKLPYCPDTLLQSYQAMQRYISEETNFSNIHSKYFNPQFSASLRLFFHALLPLISPVLKETHTSGLDVYITWP